MGKTNILICGIGEFGYAILNHLDKNLDYNNYDLSGWDIRTEVIESLDNDRVHNYLYKDHKISDKINFYSDAFQAVKVADIIVLSMASFAIIGFVDSMKEYLKDGVIMINSAKALSPNGLPFSQEIAKILEGKNYHYGVFSGGTIASDFFGGYPLGATIAYTDLHISNKMKEIFYSNMLDIEVSDDLIGTEYAGVFKNVGSIIAGYLFGKNYPYGTETYYLTNYSKEVKLLVCKYLGGKEKTFSMESYCRGDDFWMSATGKTRNREFGILLGKGEKYEDAIQIMKLQNKTVEGTYTIAYLEKLFETIDINEFSLIQKALNLKNNISFL